MTFIEYFERVLEKEHYTIILYNMLNMFLDIIISFILIPSFNGIMVGVLIYILTMLFTFGFTNSFAKNFYKTKKMDVSSDMRLKSINKRINQKWKLKKEFDFLLLSDSDATVLYLLDNTSFIVSKNALKLSDEDLFVMMLREIKQYQLGNTYNRMLVLSFNFYVLVIIIVIKLIFFVVGIICIIIGLLRKNQNKLYKKSVFVKKIIIAFIKKLYLKLGIYLVIRLMKDDEKTLDTFLVNNDYKVVLKDLIYNNVYSNGVNFLVFEINFNNTKRSEFISKL